MPKKNRHKKNKDKTTKINNPGTTTISVTPTSTLDNKNACVILKEDSKEQTMGVDVLPIIVTTEAAVPSSDLTEAKEISPILPSAPITGNNGIHMVKIFFSLK